MLDNRGELRVGLAAAGDLRWAATDLTGVLEMGRRRLDLSPHATVALGRCASAAALLMRMGTKRPVRLSVDVRGDGPMKRVFAEVEEGGAMRGLVGNPLVSQAATERSATGDGDPALAIGPLLGNGLLRVSREEPGGPSYTSQVELVTGEIGNDLAHYLKQSEQRRSAVLLGVLAQPAGVAAAGGFIVEALPGTSWDVVADLERTIQGLDSFSRRLAEVGLGATVDELLGELEPELIETQELVYRCRCSRESLLGHLMSLSQQDVADLVDDEGLLLAECAFCGTVYRYGLSELGAGLKPS